MAMADRPLFTPGVDRLLRVLTLALTLVLCCAVGLYTPYIAGLIAIAAGVMVLFRARLAEACRELPAQLFLFCFLALGVVFAASGDYTSVFNFAMLALFGPLALLLVPGRAASNGVRFAQLATAGAAVALAVALLARYTYNIPRAQFDNFGSILLGNTGQSAGATNVARTLRSFNAWFAGNASRGTGGADSTAATAAATDGNGTNGLRTFDETLLKTAVKAAYDDGGKPTRIFLGSGNKQIFSGFTGRANSQQQIGNPDKILASASVYGSDFGDLMVIPNRTQRARDVFVVDTSKVALAGLRMFEQNELGRIGDADTVELISEYTLEMRHENAHAGVMDTNAT